jgi:hypothetical protein
MSSYFGSCNIKCQTIVFKFTIHRNLEQQNVELIKIPRFRWVDTVAVLSVKV